MSHIRKLNLQNVNKGSIFTSMKSTDVLPINFRFEMLKGHRSSSSLYFITRGTFFVRDNVALRKSQVIYICMSMKFCFMLSVIYINLTKHYYENLYYLNIHQCIKLTNESRKLSFCLLCH